jgi:hypothetical protein
METFSHFFQKRNLSYVYQRVTNTSAVFSSNFSIVKQHSKNVLILSVQMNSFLILVFTVFYKWSRLKKVTR